MIYQNPTSNLLDRVEEISESASIYVSKKAPSRVAQLLSECNNGYWHYSTDGVVWRSGKRTVTLVRSELYQTCMTNRTITESLLGDSLPPHVWTRGQCSRRILAWLDVAGSDTTAGRDALLECSWHYLYAQPGEHGYCKLYDKKSAYYHIMCRLLSPKLQLTRTGVSFETITDSEASRWDSMCLAIGPTKALRNSIVGAMTPSGTTICWRLGKPAGVWMKPQYCMADTGRAIVRASYEATALQVAELGARCVYANTDSVMVHSARRQIDHLSVWDDYKLPYELVRRDGSPAAGETDVRGIGCYSIGDVRTKLYDDRAPYLPHESPHVRPVCLDSWVRC